MQLRSPLSLDPGMFAVHEQCPTLIPKVVPNFLFKIEFFIVNVHVYLHAVFTGFAAFAGAVLHFLACIDWWDGVKASAGLCYVALMRGSKHNGENTAL